MSGWFGRKQSAPQIVAQPTPVTQVKADIERDELLKRLAKLRRATLVSQLSQPNVKRRTLGAGAI